MSDKFEQCQCNAGEWQGELCGACNGTGKAALSSLQGEQEARIKELESELAEQSRLLGISAERELALQAKLAEVEKDAERYQAIKKNVEEVLVSPRTTHLDEYGLVDIRMKWQIKPTLISYTCVGENISFDEASDMLVAAMQESKKGGAV